MTAEVDPAHGTATKRHTRASRLSKITGNPVSEIRNKDAGQRWTSLQRLRSYGTTNRRRLLRRGRDQRHADLR